MFKSLGSTELIVIAFLIVFLFGARKIPEFVKGIAEALKEFKKAAKSINEEDEHKS